MDKRVKKGLDIGAIVLAVIIFMLGVCILSLSVTRKTDGVPRLFGTTFLSIQSDSMTGTFEEGDVAVVKKVKSADELKVGDIVTFWAWITVDGQTTRQLNTHRISRIVTENNGTQLDEARYYTKGDKEGLGEDNGSLIFSEIVGKYSYRIPNLGHFIDFLQSGAGFFIVVILPLTAFLGYRVYVLVKVILQMKKEKAIESGDDPEALKAELERLRSKVSALEGEGAAGAAAGEGTVDKKDG